MQALRILTHGPIDQLSVSEIPTPEIGPDDVLVEIEASAINPSDIVSAEGRFPHAVLPRTLGRDFVGRIVVGPDEFLGTRVWGAAGDLGIDRDGTHAEFVVIPRAAIAAPPPNLTAVEAAAVGIPYQTAWTALVDRGQLQAGEWIVISGATGAVGGAAIQIAAAMNAHIIALVRTDNDRHRVDQSRVAVTVSIESGALADVVRDLTGGRGVGLATNAVGASIFDLLAGSLADFGRMVIFSAQAGREVTLDLLPFYRRNLTLHGVNTVAYDVVQGARIADKLTPLFESGALAPPSIDTVFPLSRARAAYHASKSGKTILVPDGKFGG